MSEEGNEINTGGKIIGATLLISLTAGAIILLIAFWPNKMPAPGASCSLYTNQLFHIKLEDTCRYSTNKISDTENKLRSSDSPVAKKINKKDSATMDTTKQNTVGLRNIEIKNKPDSIPCKCTDDTIELNTVLLILVALAGFLGNMIHIATSFTTFIGAEKYKRSWATWYFVRPITASALAIALYFVFRGGFLNYSNDATNINVYGVMTLAILTGLFTDIATQKLKEVFQVAFKPKDDRPDKLEDPVIEVVDISGPDSIDKTKINKFLVKGKNLDKKTIIIKINSEPISNTGTKSDHIDISYQVPPSQQQATVFKLEITDGVKLISSKEFKA